jgi:hypothetical protein
MLCRVLVRISLSLSLISQLAIAEAGWQQVHPPSTFVDRTGVARRTGCSNAPTSQSAEFSFFVREGDPRRLVIAFDGGGACWDSSTCLGSVLRGSPVYQTEVDETPAHLDSIGGLFDETNPANPLRGSLQVLIPYCTGDLHMGSNDQEYVIGPVAHTIRHRGYDNMVAVLEWIADYYGNNAGTSPDLLLVTGASAGGFGATFAYPAIDRLFPAVPRKRVFVDSAIGIMNQDFYDRALAPGAAWSIWTNMPTELAGTFAAGPEAFPIAVNQSLGWSYPATRFGAYTRAYDGVQIFYLNVAKNPDEPERWVDPNQLFLTSLEWTTRARASVLESASTTANYRYYVGAGFGHVIIAGDELYLEDSAHGLPLIDWLTDMLDRRSLQGSAWRNASCFPDCLR